MSEAKRRLTVFPGEVSMVFYIGYAEALHKTLSDSLENITDPAGRAKVTVFLSKLSKAIVTGNTLKAKQSAIARGNC